MSNHNLLQQAKYWRLKGNNKCTRCGKKRARTGKATCKECAKKLHKASVRSRKLKRARERLLNKKKGNGK